ncbi:MAG: hypothetical protein HXX19_06795 [Rhodoferax sp.]|nr:hypothetical protein [Rhodoferax sp.]
MTDERKIETESANINVQSVDGQRVALTVRLFFYEDTMDQPLRSLASSYIGDVSMENIKTAISQVDAAIKFARSARLKEAQRLREISQGPRRPKVTWDQVSAALTLSRSSHRLKITHKFHEAAAAKALGVSTRTVADLRRKNEQESAAKLGAPGPMFASLITPKKVKKGK